MGQNLRLFTATVITTAALAVLEATGYGQPAPRRVYVNTTNESGAPVRDLGAAEFEVREGAEKRDVLRVALTRRPMRIALLVDTSVSAARVVPQIRAALSTFFDEIDPEHEIVLITTGGMLRVRVQPTTDRERLRAASDLLFADGGNVLLGAVVESYNRFLRSGDYQPMLLVMTVWGPGSRTWLENQELDRLAGAIRANGGTVHGVVLRLPVVVAPRGTDSRADGSDFDANIPATLANATGGLCLEMLTAEPLTEAASLLADRINGDYDASPLRYEIWYAGVGEPAVPRVQATRPGVRVEVLSSR